MADYFFCLDAEMFDGRIRPALAASWHKRSFEPCRQLCAELLPAAVDYTQRYHVQTAETLMAEIVRGLAFDSASWRLLAGEVLLFAAEEIPEFPSNSETLCCLLDCESVCDESTLRSQLAPIQQVLCGSRDLTFGAAVYRPEHAGYNNADDVARLADYLAAVRPEEWEIEKLRDVPGLCDDDERADELDFVREWFPTLVELYQRTRDKNRILVIEDIY